MKTTCLYSYVPVAALLVLHLCGPSECQRRHRDGNSGRNGGSTDLPPGWAIKSITNLATDVIHDIFHAANVGLNHNILVSPVGLWATLVMLTEAAEGETRNEISKALNLRDSRSLSFAYRRLHDAIVKHGNGAEFTFINFLMSSTDHPANQSFVRYIEKEYKGQTFLLDRHNKAASVRKINQWAAEATRNRIPSIVDEGDLENLAFVIGNGAFFKGPWKFPFNVTSTVKERFQDDMGRDMGEVEMMNQLVALPYTFSTKLDSQIIEIPYASETISMFVILPRQKIRFGDVLSRLRNTTIEEIMSSRGMAEDEVELSLPRFNVESRWTLNQVLTQMGINLVFSPANAELPHLAPKVYVTKVEHAAEIENTEEGTVSSAVTVAVISYKTKIVRFNANRPFVYFIVDKKSKATLFAGTFSNPKRG